MSVKSGQAVTVLFATSHPTTGAATDGDALPTGTLYVNGTANAVVVTVTNITTGVYKAALTLPSLAAGDVVSLRIAATVNAIAGEGVVWQEVGDTERVSDLTDEVIGTGAGLTALGDTRLANLDATVSSRGTADPGDAVTLTGDYDAAKTAAQAGDAMALTGDYDAAKTAAQAGDAMALVNDAITSAKFDESTAYPLKSADTGSTALARTGADSDTLETLSDQMDGVSAGAIADAVWDEATAGHSTAGTFGKAIADLLARIGAFTGSGVNTVLGFLRAMMRKDTDTPSDVGGAYDDATDSLEALRDKVDTLPVTASQVAETGTAGKLVTTAFVKWLQAITLDTALSATWAKAYFSVKASDSDSDDDAVMRVLVTNPADGTNDGLVRLNGSGSTTKTQASLAVAGDRASVTLTVADEAMDDIAEGTYTWDVKEIGAGSGESYRCAFGTVEIGLTTTRAIA